MAQIVDRDPPAGEPRHLERGREAAEPEVAFAIGLDALQDR